MFWTQLKLMFRNLFRNKLYSAINILGLAIAITLVLLLSSYVSNERSIDSFHANKDQIYRVYGDNINTFAPPFGQFILDNITGAECYTRTFVQEGTINYKNIKYKSGKCLLVDSVFFRMFSFPLERGNPDEVLVSYQNAVLSASFAHKLFGTSNPLGESFELDGHQFTVTGIFQDFKDNTHFIKPNIILSFSALPRLWGNGDEGTKYFMNDYSNSSFGLYVMANKNSNIMKRGPELLEKAKDVYWIFQNGRNTELSFMPLEDVYFKQGALDYIGTRQGNEKFLTILMFIAGIIVVVAAINYINLNITQSVRRAKEVGIKKIIGSLRLSIIQQFLLESTFISLLATIIAVFLTIVVLPEFNKLTDNSFSIADIFNGGFLLRSIIVVFIIGIVAGIFPSLILSRFKAIDIVKGTPSRLKNNFGQRVMVVFQYTVSIVLIAVVGFILKQNDFMRNYDLGFDKDNTFYIRMTKETNDQRDAFENELMKIPGVKAVSFCQDFPGGPINNSSFVSNGKNQSFDEFRVDTAFFSALGITLEHNISTSDNVFGDNKYACILNQTAVNELELKPPYDEFKRYDAVEKISQVIPDMNFRSLYKKTRPTVFHITDRSAAPFVLIRGTGGSLPTIVKKAKAIFKEMSPSDPIEFKFLDDALNTAYNKEERSAKIVGYFAIFAILISSLGIFALASYTAQNRKKEIGVRKVNGAKISQVMLMLNRGFVKWVAIAFLIAIPIVWFAMNKWLENFAYKTSLSWWIFALAGLLALVIALVTVSWQSWRAANKNPVEALRYE